MRTRSLVAISLAWSCAGKQTPTTPPPLDDEKVVVTDQPDEPAADPGPKRPWPSTRKADTTETLHGKTVKDPYRWLEDEKAPEVQSWMTAQDSYARGELAKLPGRAALVDRLKQLFYYDSVTAPTHRKGRYFFTRKHHDKEKSVVYWKQGEKGDEKVLLDPNTWSPDLSTGLKGTLTSWDGKYIAYMVSEHNSDESVAKIKEVATGKDLPDIIPGTKYGVTSWNPTNTGFYYTWVPPISDKVTIAARPGFAEVRFHKLGDDPAKDTVIHPATGDAKTFIGGGVSKDGRWLYVQISHGWASNEIKYRDARDPKAAWIPLVTDDGKSTFDLEIYKDQFYVRTNFEAPNFRIYKVDPKAHAKKPGDKATWKELVPAGDVPIESARIVGGKLALAYLRKASSELQLRGLDGKLVRKVELPGIGDSSGVFGDEDEDTAYFSYTSFTEPLTIYKTSIATGKSSEWTRIKLPIDTTPYTTEQVEYASKDGTRVTMFLVRKKDAKQDGTNPTILYGYGGFNASQSPGFSGSRMVWLEQGGMLAIPNLRGGGEYGEDWHRAGMLDKKQNVFDDYLAAAEWLIANKWTTKEHLAIQGGSNGGLLTGAAMVQRPDLFKAVICAVPLLDMLRYHLYGSGETWVPEYGSAAVAAQFPALYAYSPYRVAVDAGPKAYPALLLDSSDHDDRVDPMHARKFAAVIQNMTTGNAPVLLRIERNAGHGGADDVKSAVERVADTWSFLLAQLK